ncbi:MAG TPA: FliM/FliN family flagellar motor switch protein [Terriglobales bacterium]
MNSSEPKSSEMFLQMFAGAAKEVVSQIVGAAVELIVDPAPEESFTLEVPFVMEGSLTGGFSLRFSDLHVIRAACLLTGDEATAEYATATEEHREAAIELSRQICGTLASALRSRFGALELRSDDPPLDSALFNVQQQITIRTGERTISMAVALTRELLDCLDQRELSAERQESSEHAHASQANEKPSKELQDTNLAILLGLELPVCLRFGSREMLLKEVLELTSGSVVELNRRVREPVDLLIDNKLIATGEVVLVDGNYGLRVLSVANERERLACLP